MINNILFFVKKECPELEKVLLSVTFIHTWQRLPLHLNDEADLSKGNSFALTR